VRIQLTITLFLLGTFGGFLSGLLGVGGALIMIPLLLSVPQLAGLEPLSMKTVAGLSMLQVFFSSLSGLIIHKKNNFVHTRTFLSVGIPMGIFSFIGAYLSRYFDEILLMVLFEVLVVISLVILSRQKVDATAGKEAETVTFFSSFRCVLTGICIGTVSGIVGAGGGFVLVPIMLLYLKTPLKITIGTSLGIVFIGAMMGAIGKIASQQTDIIMALPLIAGSVISANLGAKTSKKLPANVLRIILIGVVIVSALLVPLRYLIENGYLS
jgi:uncharacterized membrane protein YfcA